MIGKLNQDHEIEKVTSCSFAKMDRWELSALHVTLGPEYQGEVRNKNDWRYCRGYNRVNLRTLAH